MVNLSTFNKDNSSATEDIEANFEGKEIEIGFNAKYIMDMLENLKENEIQFHLWIIHLLLLQRKNLILI